MGTRGRFPAKPEKAQLHSIKMPQRYRGPKHTRISERPALFFLRYLVLAVVVHAGLGVGVCADPEYNIRFQQISIEAGLSQSSIDCLLLDSRGFMWFGTQDGLNRYDGYHFEIYKHDPADPDTLSNSYILSIYEDSSGTIWIGTESGLNSYQRSTNGFSRYSLGSQTGIPAGRNRIQCIYEASSAPGIMWIGTENGLIRYDTGLESVDVLRHKTDDPGGLSHDNVISVYEAPSFPGVLWIATQEGLDRYHLESGHVEHFLHNPDRTDSLSHNNVRIVYESPSEPGTLWVGTEKGLNTFDPQEGTFRRYLHVPGDPDTLSHDYVRAILESPQDSRYLWIGTFGGGLNRFDKEQNSFSHWRHETGNPDSLSDDFINHLYEDSSGIFWVGTEGGGVNKSSHSAGKFVHYKHNINNSNSLGHNHVRSIIESRAEPGIFWIGTYGGLNRLDRQENTFAHFTHRPGDPGSLSSDLVRVVLEDRSGTLWIGTFDGGLNRYDRRRRRFTAFRNEPGNPSSLSHDYVRTLFEDRSGRLWVGTVGGGLNRMDSLTGKFHRYPVLPDDERSLNSDRVYAICQDDDGMIWIGTAGGLACLDPERETFTCYQHHPEDPGSLSNNLIMCVYIDRTGTLWAGSYGGGLLRLNRSSQRFVRYTQKEGLPNDVIYGILEDKNGRLWLSTNFGLSRFDPGSDTFKNYDVRDGLQSNEFNAGAYYKSAGGEMIFGGINGLTLFHPERITNNPHIPPIVITDLQLFNHSVSIGNQEGGRTILERSIMETRRLRLSYLDRVISFEFSALDYTSPEKNQYAYMMENLEDEWNYVGDRRYATYTTLPPGRYVFRVKGSNNDGVWNEDGVALQLTITPPFWQTWWFRGLGFAAVLLAILAVNQIRTAAIRRRNQELVAHVEERTSELRNANLKLQNEISFREEVEQEIRQLKEFNENIVQNMTEGIVVQDKSRHLTFTNPAAAELLGYEAQELIGKDWKHIIPPDQYPIIAAADELRAKGESSRYEVEMKSKNGRRIPVQVSGCPIFRNGRDAGTIAVFTDISELKRAEEIKRRREAQSALIYKVGQHLSSELELQALLSEIVTAVHEAFNYHAVMLLLVDEQGEHLRLHSIAGAHTSIFPEDYLVEVGKGMIGFAVKSGKTQVSGDVDKNPHYFRWKGEQTTSELSVPFRSGGRIIGVLDIQSDVNNAFDETDVASMETLCTQIASAIKNASLYDQSQREIVERRKVEDLLKKLSSELLRSNKELEQFAYIASHDLQEPLRMVSSFVQLLARRYKGELDADAHEFIGYAVDGATRMQRMINDLLTYSRVGTKGKPFGVTDCESVYAQAVSNLKIAAEESRAVVTHDRLPTLMADETQLVQLFQNLIGNAIKFQDNHNPPEIHISAEETGNEWLFKVRDNGVGIDPEYAERIFQIFQRTPGKTEHSGTGIGLAVCRRIVERHGGRIWVDSQPGQGATFSFTLPIRSDDQK